MKAFLCYIFLIILHIRKGVYSEWVDIPEFSDETKIYRISIPKREFQYKFIRKVDDNNPFRKEHIDTVKESNYHTTQLSAIFIPTEITTKSVFTSTEFSTSADSNENDCITTNISYIHAMDEVLTTSSSIESQNNNKLPLVDTQCDNNTAMSKQQTSLPNKNYNETLEEKQDNLLTYLPTDILKKVHYSLKSQPTTIDGKFQFLKSIERMLLAEIESRLGKTMAPIRSRRGSSDHYDHGYDDHDEHSLGFPSIEGALMAISFLTFAVYLVRLVMLLFRNINNTNQTTTGATLLVGKKKRFIEEFDENTAKILSNMDNFVSNYKL